MTFTKIYLSVILLILSITTYGQTEYHINNFSDKYSAKLTIESGFENEIFKKGVISIYQKQSKEEIIKIESEEFTFELDNQKNIEVNKLELPYGKQSIIISQDFNFDGIKDLAILDGYNSCYHGPSFRVYLEKKNKLIYSPEFTKLSQEYCGMFHIVSEKKIIKTKTKASCCWHIYSTFKLINNLPKLTSILEVKDEDYPFQELTQIEWDKNGNKKSEVIEKIIDFEEENLNSEYNRIAKLLSFELANNKKIIIYKTRTPNGLKWHLNFVILKSNGTLESYSNSKYRTTPFSYNKIKNELTFYYFGINDEKEIATIYKIYEFTKKGKKREIGIEISEKYSDKKAEKIIGNISSLKGTLIDFEKQIVDNLYNE